MCTTPTKPAPIATTPALCHPAYWPLLSFCWSAAWLAGAVTATAEKWRQTAKPYSGKTISSPLLKLHVQTLSLKPATKPRPPAAPTPLHLV